MKIWLNHTLACPDDASFPLELTIFKWDKPDVIPTDDVKDVLTTEGLFEKMIEGYNSRTLENVKGTNPPLTIEFFTGPDLSQQNLQKMQTDTGIIRIYDDLIADMVIINPISLPDYLGIYQGILNEFSVIKDISGDGLALDAYNLIVQSIIPKFTSKLKEYTKNPMKSNQLGRFLEPIFQELLFLNIYLTYVEIEEGLLVCPHCKRWFPIMQTIPRIYPKSMKREQMDLDFREKWRESYPKDVIMD